MRNDRVLRRLTDLEKSASTARVLNLLHTHRQRGAAPELAAKPLFKNAMLDRCILLKHRLRPHEYNDFHSHRTTATKILVPIDFSDLKSGARTLFVGQKDFEAIATAAFGNGFEAGSRDRQVLELMDELPSLDPFLLREQLRKIEIEPSRLYFNITDADVIRMYEFARGELFALAMMSGANASDAQSHGAKLVDKLLSNSPDSGFLPLKETLRLSDQEYLDGIYAWRGFLYYKWVLADLHKPVPKVLAEIMGTKPVGTMAYDKRREIEQVRARLQAAILIAIERTSQSIAMYDRAYEALTKEGKPSVFREFLLAAPERFLKLGEELGTLQHIVSFWRYRFTEGKPRLIDTEDLLDLLLDFELGLGPAAARAA